MAKQIFFVGKSVVLHLLERPDLRTHHWEDCVEKKAQHPSGFEPMTSLLRGVCSTAVLQLLPSIERDNAQQGPKVFRARKKLLILNKFRKQKYYWPHSRLYICHYYQFGPVIKGLKMSHPTLSLSEWLDLYGRHTKTIHWLLPVCEPFFLNRNTRSR